MDNKEIRDILLGRIVRLDDKLWAAAPAGTKVHFHGVRDGAGDVRLFGVIQRSHRYRTEEMEEAIAFAAGLRHFDCLASGQIIQGDGFLYDDSLILWRLPRLLRVSQ